MVKNSVLILHIIMDLTVLSKNDTAKKFITDLYKSVDKFKFLKKTAKYGGDILLTGGIGTLADFAISDVI